MFYPFASSLFPTLACETSKHCTLILTVFHVCISNASNTEFHLFIALGNEMDMASLTLSISK